MDADCWHVACCVGPTLLGTRRCTRQRQRRPRPRHRSLWPSGHPGALPRHGARLSLIRRGQGSLVTSLYGSDPAALAAAALELADSHGRVHVISPDVAALHTGHGNVMPQSLHGGPGRAGGGEELGGLRALNFYHRRSAVQASTAVLSALSDGN